MKYFSRIQSLPDESIKRLRTSISRKIVLRTVAILLGLYVFGLIMTGVSVYRAGNSVSDINISSALAGGEPELVRLENQLGVFDFRVQRFSSWSMPVRQFMKMFGFVGLIEDHRIAAEMSLERVDIDYAAAIVAVELARTTFRMRDEVFGEPISISNDDDLIILKTRLHELNLASAEVLDLLAGASLISRQLGELNTVGMVGSVDQRMTAQEARLATLAEFASILAELTLVDLSLMSDMQETVSELKSFTRGENSLTELSARLDQLATQLETASEMSLAMSDTMPASIRESEYGQLVEGVTDLNLSASGLVNGLVTVFDTTRALLDSVSSSSGPIINDKEAMTDVVTMLIDREDELASTADLILENVRSLQNLEQAGPFSTAEFTNILGDRVESLVSLADIFENFPRLVSEIFAVGGGTKRYLLLGNTSDELRAVGGFTSSLWLLTFEDGALKSREYFDVLHLESKNNLALYPSSTEELRVHMDAGQLYMRDVGWDPHFPSVGRQAIELFEIERDVEVDGVISLSQWAFVDLATALGRENVLTSLEAGTDTEGTSYLDTIFDSMISLSGGRMQSIGLELMTTVSRLFRSKDLMIYGRDDEFQSRVVSSGLDGAVHNSAAGDRLLVIDSNVGWNKVDRNIGRRFFYSVDLSEPDSPNSELTLEYENQSVSEPTDCDVQSHVSGSYEDLLNDCYWNFVRVYVPNGAILMGGDGLPLPDGAIAARVGGERPGADTVVHTFDDNGAYSSGLLSVAPQNSRTIRFEYELPPTTLESHGDGVFEYSLVIGVQAGIRGRSGTVRLILPDESEILEMTPISSTRNGHIVELDLDSVADQTITLIFRVPENNVSS